MLAGKGFDLVTRMIEYENGALDEEETVELFQELVNTGLVWQLQGSYGRYAAQLICAGLVTAPNNTTES